MGKQIFAILLLLVFSLSANSSDADFKKVFSRSIYTNFRGGVDSLCFDNKGFTAHAGLNPRLQVLARVADSEGSCQGMVAMASAVKTKVKFRPNKEKMSASEISNRLEKVKIYTSWVAQKKSISMVTQIFKSSVKNMKRHYEEDLWITTSRLQKKIFFQTVGAFLTKAPLPHKQKYLNT